MYPPPSDGGLGRFIPSGGSGGSLWSARAPVCRPRFWKLFLLVILLLMMAQFSLNILFYRNYDSLFYVNVTSAETLATFESKVCEIDWICRFMLAFSFEIFDIYVDALGTVYYFVL